MDCLDLRELRRHSRDAILQLMSGFGQPLDAIRQTDILVPLKAIAVLEQGHGDEAERHQANHPPRKLRDSGKDKNCATRAAG